MVAAKKPNDGLGKLIRLLIDFDAFVVSARPTTMEELLTILVDNDLLDDSNQGKVLSCETAEEQLAALVEMLIVDGILEPSYRKDLGLPEPEPSPLPSLG